MTFVDMVNEVIAFRFRPAMSGSVERWINLRYQWLWGAAEWPWKIAAPTNLTVTAGVSAAAYATATDVRRPLAVIRDDGQELNYLNPREYWDTYQGETSSGLAQDYTVINGVIYLAPIPGSAATFTVPYERACTLLDDDGDEPLMPDAYHYMLVIGAIATGLKMEGDPTWNALEQEFGALYDAMVSDLLPADRAVNQQYGRTMVT